jgi:hypothetical protein
MMFSDGIPKINYLGQDAWQSRRSRTLHSLGYDVALYFTSWSDVPVEDFISSIGLALDIHELIYKWDDLMEKGQVALPETLEGQIFEICSSYQVDFDPLRPFVTRTFQYIATFGFPGCARPKDIEDFLTCKSSDLVLLKEALRLGLKLSPCRYRDAAFVSLVRMRELYDDIRDVEDDSRKGLWSAAVALAHGEVSPEWVRSFCDREVAAINSLLLNVLSTKYCNGLAVMLRAEQEHYLQGL